MNLSYQHTKPFIVVRFAAGSGGRFISTLLQLSPDVAHWNPLLDDNMDGYQEYLDYSFPTVPDEHLRVEPDLPYNTDFYSGTYDRGTDITFEQYSANQCEYFFKNINSKKYVNLILHKSPIPQFMHGSSIVNIMIDTPDALEFAQKMLWLKHYKVVGENKINQLTHDPTTCNKKRSDVVRKFYKGSSVINVTNIKDYYASAVFNNEMRMFQSVDLLLSDDTNLTCKQHYFFLSNIFDEERLESNIKHICASIGIRAPDKGLLTYSFNKWWNSQNMILNHWSLK